jgi:hypothetical protein
VDTRDIKKFKESDMWESIADLQPPSPGNGESIGATSLKRKYKEFERDLLVYEQIVKYRSQRVEDVKAVSNLCKIRVEEARLAAVEQECLTAFQVASLAKRNSAVLESCLLEDLKKVEEVEEGIEEEVKGMKKVFLGKSL